MKMSIIAYKIEEIADVLCYVVSTFDNETERKNIIELLIESEKFIRSIEDIAHCLNADLEVYK